MLSHQTANQKQMRVNKIMKIYSFKKDSLTGDNLVSILDKDGLFTAITRTDSKDFKNLDSAKNWLAKKGYETVIEIEEVK